MHSDDSPPDGDDQLPDSEPQRVPAQPPGQRPAWLIWTIVGGAAALVAIAGAVGIVAISNRGTPDETSIGPPDDAAAAVYQLRSHLPEDLRFAEECEEDSPLPDARATIECTWPSSDLPHTATYSLFDDSTSMLKTALTLVRGSDHGPSCRSANDFSDSGGQMLWRRDDRDRGTVWCFLSEDGEPVIVWTDTTPKILASAIAPAEEDAGQLLEWFLTVGQASLGAEPSPLPPPQQVPTDKSPERPDPNTPTSRSSQPPKSTEPVESPSS